MVAVCIWEGESTQSVLLGVQDIRTVAPVSFWGFLWERLSADKKTLGQKSAE